MNNEAEISSLIKILKDSPELKRFLTLSVEELKGKWAATGFDARDTRERLYTELHMLTQLQMRLGHYGKD